MIWDARVGRHVMKVSAVIPNRNDTVMLSVTVRSILEELKGVYGCSEIVICDNSDDDIWAIMKKPNVSPLGVAYISQGKIKLVRQETPGLFAAREMAIEKSSGKYTVNFDSHVLCGRGSISDLVDFMDADVDEKVGFAFRPIGWTNKHEMMATGDIRPNDNGSVFGPWGRAYSKPTKISWHFGGYITRRKWFLDDLGGHGFFSDGTISWGGGEFYTAMKSWLFGKENWTIPTSPAYHIGPWSKEVTALSGIPYRVYSGSGNGKIGIGILAAFYALGGDEIKEYVRKNSLGLKVNHGIDIDRDWAEARRLAYKDRKFIDSNQVISFRELLKTQPWMDGWGPDRWTDYKAVKQWEANTL